MTRSRLQECPSCAMEVPKAARQCPVCGYEFPRPRYGLIIGVVILLIIYLLSLWW